MVVGLPGVPVVVTWYAHHSSLSPVSAQTQLIISPLNSHERWRLSANQREALLTTQLGDLSLLTSGENITLLLSHIHLQLGDLHSPFSIPTLTLPANRLLECPYI